MDIPKTMKAMTLTAYDHLALAELPVPQPGPGEVLCRIRSVAICGSDPKMIHGHYAFANWPPYYPFVMGHEWAGEVVALGAGVEEFRVGDRVAGEAHAGCGKCDNCKRGHYTVCLNYGRDGHDGGLDTSDKSVVVDWYYKKLSPEGRSVLHYCKFCNGVVLYASETDPALAVLRCTA